MSGPFDKPMSDPSLDKFYSPTAIQQRRVDRSCTDSQSRGNHNNACKRAHDAYQKMKEERKE